MLPDALIELLKNATRVVALTGAGVSAESGVPTFRDAQTGLWSRYRAEDLATLEAFQRNPALVWNWYAWRRSLVEAVEPNPAHFALASLEQRIPGFNLITQNVDGLHFRAGSRKVLALHGDLFLTLCSVENTPVETWRDSDEVPPRCPRCDAPLRPGVVWFGEALPQDVLSQSMALSAACQVFLSIGTSALVQPAAFLPLMAYESGRWCWKSIPTRHRSRKSPDSCCGNPQGKLSRNSSMPPGRRDDFPSRPGCDFGHQ